MASITDSKKRYAIVGAGGRAIFFYTAIAQDYAQTSCIVGLCDTNATRMSYANSKLESMGHFAVPTYSETDFDRMISETKPDEVIVTTIDRTHHTYIIRALELGCNVITEKPMTIDVPRTQAIFDAVQRTGKQVSSRPTNAVYSYVPFASRWLHSTLESDIIRFGLRSTIVTHRTTPR
jgi:predicted dehydrogenase